MRQFLAITIVLGLVNPASATELSSLANRKQSNAVAVHDQQPATSLSVRAGQVLRWSASLKSSGIGIYTVRICDSLAGPISHTASSVRVSNSQTLLSQFVRMQV